MITDLAGVADQVRDGYTLPLAWYTEPEIHRLERERIFRRTWQYAAPIEWLAEPGDFVACRAGHIPLVVVRDGDGGLRAFLNVCRHRGHLVAAGCGNRKSLQCPYHAWTYALDGTLRTVPRGEREPDLRPEELGLLPASAEAFGPFVFVNPDPAAAPLADTLGDLPEAIAAAGLDVGALAFHERIEWTLDVNWKVAIENDLECYHCPVAHPGFSDLIDVSPDAYRLETGPAYTSQYGPLRDGVRANGSAPYDTSGAVARSQAHLVWPNVSINVNPGPPNAGMHLWRPDGPHRIAGLSDYFFAPGTDPDVVAGILAFDREVGAEDNALVRGVQEGIDSGMLDRGRVLAESERLVRHFQLMVAEALAP